MSANVEEHRPGVSGELRTGVVLRRSKNPEQVQYSAIDGLAIFEGDIILGTVAQMDQLLLGVPALVGTDRMRWPNAVVPFQLDTSLPTQTRNRIRDAIDHWEQNTIIRFRPRSQNDNDFVTFRPSTGCSANVGRNVV